MTPGPWLAARPLTLTSSQQELLKWVALVTMLLDHANKTLWTFQPFLFLVGRLAFPLFIWLLGYNLEVRKAKWQKYFVPLMVIGLLSQPIKMTLMDMPWWYLNIMFTLLLGVLF
jgi:TraX protein